MDSSVISVLMLCVIGLKLHCAADTLRSNSLSLVQDKQFDGWTKKHGKRYETVEEFQIRYAVFKDSAKRVREHNNKGLSYKLELNKFADMTHEEFSQLHLLSNPQNCSATHGRERNLMKGPSQIPESIDWRKKGVVSGVKNQGQCGSCWTFSTTGCMESHVAIQYGRMYNLSEQQLVDCAQAFNNKGCSGGLPSQAFEYIHYNPGLMQEKDYPYTAKDGPCVFESDKAVAFVKEVYNITEKDEDGLKAAVGTVGPVSIAFQVASDFRLYKSGVYKSTVCLSDPMHVNHAVLAVGYDTTPSGEPYWIVKNSWGATWGINGYFNIYRGKNMCGLADCASYPITAQHPTVK